MLQDYPVLGGRGDFKKYIELIRAYLGQICDITGSRAYLAQIYDITGSDVRSVSSLYKIYDVEFFSPLSHSSMFYTWTLYHQRETFYVYEVDAYL